jgi:hypothetical protein
VKSGRGKRRKYRPKVSEADLDRPKRKKKQQLNKQQIKNELARHEDGEWEKLLDD